MSKDRGRVDCIIATSSGSRRSSLGARRASSGSRRANSRSRGSSLVSRRASSRTRQADNTTQAVNNPDTLNTESSLTRSLGGRQSSGVPMDLAGVKYEAQESRVILPPVDDGF